MKNFKKIVSLVLTVCLMASLAIGASAANTVDASGGRHVFRYSVLDCRWQHRRRPGSY